jgi:hypothetical protein
MSVNHGGELGSEDKQQKDDRHPPNKDLQAPEEN